MRYFGPQAGLYRPPRRPSIKVRRPSLKTYETHRTKYFVDKKTPTPAEHELLELLWQHGPATVRKLHERQQERRASSYTTVLKLLQIMTEKGLVSRDESERSHVYHPAVSRPTVQKNALHRFVERMFAGSTHDLVVGALSGEKSDPDELRAIRAHIDALLHSHEPDDIDTNQSASRNGDST